MIAPRCLIIFLLFYPIVRNGNCDSIMESSFDSSENSKKNISNDDGGTTTEIHYTTCKITTEQLVAEAQATFTRVLKGACNAKMIEERFEKLENSLNERFNEIRESIDRSFTRQNFYFSETNDDDDDDNDDVEGKVKTVFAKKNHFSENYVDNDENKFYNGNKERNRMISSSRQDEIENYNNTVHDDEDRRNVYTYYWRVSNLYEKLLKWKTGRSERSSSFYVGNAGYSMYLRFTPKYFPDGTIFISVGLTVGRNDSKINWPFPLQIRIEILDLATLPNERPKDRSSRLWDPATVCSSYFWGRPRRKFTSETSDNPECVGLSINRKLLKNFAVEQKISSSSLSSENYVSNDSLLVKLTVYL